MRGNDKRLCLNEKDRDKDKKDYRRVPKIKICMLIMFILKHNFSRELIDL